MRRSLRVFGPLFLGLLGCSDDPEFVTDPDEPKVEVEALSPTDHLVRASMALRGKRPSLAELSKVAKDPKAIDGIIDTYLETPEFGETVREIHNESLMLRPDWAYYPSGFPATPPLDHLDRVTINNAVMEAPLRLIESVVMNDEPYSEIVTADYTLANDIVATVWGLEGVTGSEWQKTKWTDGRGNAGILTDSWLYVRWQSTPSNANRGRANLLSRALLCYDFLSRDVELDTSVNVADPNAVQNAVVDNPACASCHQALDPLASFFKDMFPIVVVADTETYPTYPSQAMWFPGVFEDYLEIKMRPTSYFGAEGKTLEDLGRNIAEDPRFSLCAAKRFYAHLNHVPLEEVPLERAAELQEVFEDSGLSAKALSKAVVLSDDFRASYAKTDVGAEEVVGMRRARPTEIANLIQDLTGYVWATDLADYTENDIGYVDLARDSFIGYRVVGGGTDAAYVTQTSFTDNATTNLFLRAFAEGAAAWVVTQDFALPAKQRKLLGKVELDTTDEATLRKQIAELHARVFGTLDAEDSEAVDETLALFKGALDVSKDPARAWQTLVTAMLQDLRVGYY